MKLSLRSLLLAATFAGSSSAFAATQTWQQANSDNNWNTTATNWDAGVIWTNGNDATFGGTGESVTLGSGIIANNLTFSAGGYTLSGGTLALGGATPTITASTGTTIINSALAGAGFTVKGAGNITFGGTDSNTFTGTLTIDTTGAANTRSITFNKTGAAKAIADNGVINFGTGTPGETNLRMGASDQFGTGVVVNFNNAAASWTRLDMRGTNQTLAGVNSGTLTSGGSGIIQNQSISDATAYGNSVLTLNGSGTYLFNGYIRDEDDSGTASKIGLIKEGTGTQILAGANINYTGTTTINAGTLLLNNTTAYRSATTVNGGVLQVRGALGAAAITVNSGGALMGTGSTTGAVSLNDGATIVGGLSTGSGVAATNAFRTTSTLAVSGTVNISGSDGSGTIGSHTIDVIQYTGTDPLAGNFSTANNFRNAGAVTTGVAASGANKKVTLTYTNEQRTWNSGNAVWDTLNTTAWQENDQKFSAGDAVVFNNTGAGAGAARQVTLNSMVTPGLVTFDNDTSNPYSVSGTGSIAGATSLVKNGAGTVTLSTSNSYTGTTTINAGTLELGGGVYSGNIANAGALASVAFVRRRRRKAGVAKVA